MDKELPSHLSALLDIMWLILCRWKKSVVRKCRIVPYILDTGLLQVSISAFHKIRLVVIEWGQFMSKIVREELVLFQRCLLNTGFLTRFACQQQHFPPRKTMLAGLSGKAGGKRSIWSYCFKVRLFFLSVLISFDAEACLLRPCHLLMHSSAFGRFDVKLHHSLDCL